MAKTARMEATASPGFGGGIPAKIEESIEPGDRGGGVGGGGGGGCGGGGVGGGGGGGGANAK